MWGQIISWRILDILTKWGLHWFQWTNMWNDRYETMSEISLRWRRRGHFSTLKKKWDMKEMVSFSYSVPPAHNTTVKNNWQQRAVTSLSMQRRWKCRQRFYCFLPHNIQVFWACCRKCYYKQMPTPGYFFAKSNNHIVTFWDCVWVARQRSRPWTHWSLWAICFLLVMISFI